MEPQQPMGLQLLILRRLAELGGPGRPLSLREACERSGGVLSYAYLRALARGEREILTAGEAAALAKALEVPDRDVAAVATVLPDV